MSQQIERINRTWRLMSNASNYQYLQRLKQLCVFLDESEQEEFLNKNFPIDDPIHRLKPLNAVTMDAWLGFFKYDEGGRMKSKKSFDAFVSAYRYFFKKRKEEFSHGGTSVDPSFRDDIEEEVEQTIKTSSATYKRTHTEKKAVAQPGQYKDKQAAFLPRKALIEIQKRTHKTLGSRPHSVLEHAVFGSVCINAGCRGDSTGSIKRANIRMGATGDCITVRFGAKHDQHGDYDVPRSLHANPFVPWVCVMFNIGLMTLASTEAFKSEYLCGHQSKKKGTRVNRSTAVDSYAAHFASIIREMTDAEAADILGGSKDEYTLYAIRHGILTLLGGSYGGTSIGVAIRAGHSMGAIGDTYFDQEPGQDAHFMSGYPLAWTRHSCNGWLHRLQGEEKMRAIGRAHV